MSRKSSTMAVGASGWGTTAPDWIVRVTVPERDFSTPAPDDVGLDTLDEASLVRACVQGRPGAFDVLVARHRRAVYQLCYRFAGNPEDAADLAQEVFLRAYRALDRFKGESALGTWLYRIAVNLCLNRKSGKTPAMEPLDEHRALAAAGPDAAGLLLAEERAARVRAAVARLPDKQQAALILRVYQEMSHQEIAAVLGISEGAAKANVFYAIKNLRKLIGEGWR